MSGTSTIAWPEALLNAHRLAGGADAAARTVDAALSSAPCFQNRAFPFSPLPLLIRGGAAENLRPALTAYLDLLGTAVRHYREHPEVRRWYGLPAAADRLINADPGPSDAPWVCRLDGYLERNTERLVVLENNADAPAGTLFTARINTLAERICTTVAGTAPRLSPLTYRGRDLFLNALLAGARAAGAATGKTADPQHVAVLQPAGAANRESREMVAEFQNRGFHAYLADPRELRVAGGRARFGTRPVDLCWNKVNTVGWNDMAGDAVFVRAWERALRDTPLVHLNSFGARYVAENKATLAFLQEPEFAALFTDEQRCLAARLLPWTRRITPTATTDGQEELLVDHLLERQAEFVTKEPYDIRGDGVTIGYAVSRGEWSAAVRRGVEHGHIAQRRIQPTHYPVITPGSDQVAMMPVSLDTYLLDGQIAGFGAKASHNAKINIFQGGQKLAVHVLEEPRELG